MSIIEKPVTTQKTPASEWQEIKKRNYELYKVILNLHTASFKQVWQNSNGFTPEQMVEIMGTDGKAIFENSSMIQQILKSTDPIYEFMLPTKNVTINQDGTVTLS